MGHEKHYLQRPIDSPLPLRLSICYHRNKARTTRKLLVALK